jgi:hypothetical protein
MYDGVVVVYIVDDMCDGVMVVYIVDSMCDGVMVVYIVDSMCDGFVVYTVDGMCDGFVVYIVDGKCDGAVVYIVDSTCDGAVVYTVDAMCDGVFCAEHKREPPGPQRQQLTGEEYNFQSEEERSEQEAETTGLASGVAALADVDAADPREVAGGNILCYFYNNMIK